jgi:hypothetical protein
LRLVRQELEGVTEEIEFLVEALDRVPYLGGVVEEQRGHRSEEVFTERHELRVFCPTNYLVESVVIG